MHTFYNGNSLSPCSLYRWKESDPHSHQRKENCQPPIFNFFLGELHNLFEEARMDRGVIMVSEVLRLLQAHR
jgi:hypothetical protein